MIRWLIDRVLRGLLNHYIVRSVDRSFFKPVKYPVIVQCQLLANSSVYKLYNTMYKAVRRLEIVKIRKNIKHSRYLILEAYEVKLDRWLLISPYLGCFWILVQVLLQKPLIPQSFVLNILPRIRIHEGSATCQLPWSGSGKICGSISFDSLDPDPEKYADPKVAKFNKKIGKKEKPQTTHFKYLLSRNNLLKNEKTEM